MINKALSIIAALTLATSLQIQADTFTIDTAHAEILFKVKHLVSNVTGSFDDFEGTLTLDPADRSTLKAEASIETKSVNTRNEKRDKHLRNKDFFDAENHPTISFTSKEVKIGKGDNVTVTGTLDMHGVKKDITLRGELSQPMKDPWGMTRIALSLEGTIQRKDWNIGFNKKLDNGGLLLGEAVKLEISLEGVQKK